MKKVTGMKKICSMFLAICIVATFIGCGEKVPEKLTDFELGAQQAVELAREKLIDPSSMSINHIYGVDHQTGLESGFYIYKVDYTGKTRGGGVGRGTEYFALRVEGTYSEDGTLTSLDWSDLSSYVPTQVNYDEYSKELGYVEFDPTTYVLNHVVKPTVNSYN